jgi:hypothetical protein
VFVAVDGTHVAPRATRFEAPDPAKRAPLLRRLCPEIGRGSRSGMQFAWLRAAPEGTAAPSPSSPLKENFLWARTFDTVGGRRQALLAFREGYQHNLARRTVQDPRDRPAEPAFTRGARRVRFNPVSHKPRAVHILPIAAALLRSGGTLKVVREGAGRLMHRGKR